MDTVVDELLRADELNCFLLKEVATNFILTHAKEVLASPSFENIPESKSVVREIFSLMVMSREGEGRKDRSDPANLTINELRAKLYDMGEDFDGPRNALIARLTNAADLVADEAH